jgi:SHS2 domain-containing protein
VNGERLGRGHRAVPHTSDVILEAWGADLASCCEEAVTALLGSFIDVRAAVVVEERILEISTASPDLALLALLDEVLFVIDTADSVPVAAHVTPGPDGTLRVQLDGADPRSVEPSGAAPKAISRSGLRVEVGPSGVRCAFLVDV